MTLWPIHGVEGDDVKSAERTAETVTVWLAVAVSAGVEESVTVRVTLNDPGDANAWVGLAAVLVPPSPKFQLYVSGVVPPVTVEVKVTIPPITGFAGDEVKSAASPVETVTV